MLLMTLVLVTVYQLPSQMYAEYLAHLTTFEAFLLCSIIWKIVEHCLLDKYGSLLQSSDNQFGFKRSLDTLVQLNH